MAQSVDRSPKVRADRRPADRGRIGAQVALQQPLDGRSDPIDDRPEIAGLGFSRPLQLLECRFDRATVRVTEHHDEPRLELLRGKLHTADLRGRDDIPGNADDEQIP